MQSGDTDSGSPKQPAAAARTPGGHEAGDAAGQKGPDGPRDADVDTAGDQGPLTGGGSGGGKGDGSGGDGAPVADAPRPERRLWSRPWFPVLIACVLALVVLAFLLLPGVLMYPDRPVVSVGNDEAALAAQRATNQALEERIGVLERVLDAAVCRAPDGFVLPEGGLPPMPGLPGGLPSTVPPQTLLPPLPERTMIAPPAGATQGPEAAAGPGGVATDGAAAGAPTDGAQRQGASLTDLLDAATVLVIATAPGGLGIGSGVVIGPGRVMTNRHVIDEAVAAGAEGNVYLTSQMLGRVVPARIAAASNAAAAPLDLAVLDADGLESLRPLSFSTSVERLGNVVAAGYPGAIVQFDEKFRRLLDGDMSAAPQLALTQGMVTVIQNTETMPIIGHTAPISKGNSGGPLVDMCGRVLGINTFGPRDVQTIGYAQSARIVQDFLRGAGVTVTVLASRCEPEVMAARGAQPAAAAPSPAAAAPNAPAGEPTPAATP